MKPNIAEPNIGDARSSINAMSPSSSTLATSSLGRSRQLFGKGSPISRPLTSGNAVPWGSLFPCIGLSSSSFAGYAARVFTCFGCTVS